jgi:hypothetical protein
MRIRRHLPSHPFRLRLAPASLVWTLTVCLGLHLPDPCLAQGAPASAASDAAFRLPGVRSYFKKRGEQARPAITLEEAERCISLDAKVREQVQKLMARRDELTRQREPLAAEQLSIQQVSEQIKAKREALTKDFAQAQRVNDDPKAQQAHRQMLMTSQQAFNQAVAAHNVQVAALQARFSEWDVQWQAWVSETQAVDAEGQRQNQLCASDRSLVRPAAASTPSQP